MTYIELISTKKHPYTDSYTVEESYEEVLDDIKGSRGMFIEVTPTQNSYDYQPTKVTINVRSIKRVHP